MGFTLGMLLVFIVLLLCCGSLVGLLVFATNSSEIIDQSYTEEVIKEGTVSEKIIVLELDDIIMDVDDGIHASTIVEYIKSGLAEAEKRDTIKGVIISVNSPGGSAYDSLVLGEAISDFKEQTDKPVVVVMEDLAASGGYWVSAYGDRIFLSKQTITGSIGVVIEFYEFDELFDKLGIDAISITNTEGVNKRPENLEDPESEGHLAYKRLTDESFENFLEIIMENRGMSREDLLPYTDGRLLGATDALAGNLADEIGDLEDAVSFIQEEQSLNNPHVVRFARNELLGWTSFATKVNVLFNGAYSKNKVGVGMYLLPEEMMQ